MNRNAREVAEAIGVHTDHWPGQCYAIASAILEAGLAPEGTELRYGHWLGAVSPNCPVEGFRNGAPFQRHGWLEIPGDALEVKCRRCGHVVEDHGTGFMRECEYCDCPDFEPAAIPQVIDPTRYVFEGREPYVYVGVIDYYDAGGNAWREVLQRPLPKYDPEDQHVTLDTWKFSRPAHEFVIGELFAGRARITMPMIAWLANLPLRRLEIHANPIYRAIAEIPYCAALIPIDNWQLVMGMSGPRTPHDAVRESR